MSPKCCVTHLSGRAEHSPEQRVMRALADLRQETPRPLRTREPTSLAQQMQLVRHARRERERRAGLRSRRRIGLRRAPRRHKRRGESDDAVSGGVDQQAGLRDGRHAAGELRRARSGRGRERLSDVMAGPRQWRMDAADHAAAAAQPQRGDKHPRVSGLSGGRSMADRNERSWTAYRPQIRCRSSSKAFRGCTSDIPAAARRSHSRLSQMWSASRSPT